MKRALLLFFGSLLLHTLSAQTEANAVFSFDLRGLNSNVLQLGYYLGGQAYKVDSISVKHLEGRFTFREKGLKPGLYFLSNGGRRVFDFMVTSPSDSFWVKGTLAGDIPDLKAENSSENEAFFAFEKERRELEGKIKAKSTLVDMVAKATHDDPNSLAPIRKELESMYREGDSLAIAFTQNHPKLLYTRMLLSVRPPDPPKKIKPLIEGKTNPAYFAWEKAHYFDRTDFKNEALLNNNFWHSFFDNYFARYIVRRPDSLQSAIDVVLGKMPRNGAFYRFAVMRLTQYFEQNEAPGADQIFVHLVDKYLEKETTPWLDISLLERLAYKADANRGNLTGSMAINFTLPDEKELQHSLYDVQAPVTMLVFYSPLCDHCKELMPKIYQTHLDYQSKGLKTIALNTDANFAYWKKFVGQQGWQWLNLAGPEGIPELEKQFSAVNLPVIYLLDKDKRIVAKRVRIEQLGEMLARMEW